MATIKKLQWHKRPGNGFYAFPDAWKATYRPRKLIIRKVDRIDASDLAWGLFLQSGSSCGLLANYETASRAREAGHRWAERFGDHKPDLVSP